MSKDIVTGAVKQTSSKALATADPRFDNVDPILAKAGTSILAKAGTSIPAKPNESVEAEALRKKLTLMLDEADWKAFRIRCLDEGVSGQVILERLVKRFLAE